MRLNGLGGALRRSPRIGAAALLALALAGCAAAPEAPPRGEAALPTAQIPAIHAPPVHAPLPRRPGEAAAEIAPRDGDEDGADDGAAPDPGDPWALIVAEASERFDVPEAWIRTVIRHESGGRAFVGGRPLRGPGGTIGLMQLSPDTYRVMRERYDLGPDPADPYDNVMAGTALIREMYEEFGAPLFIAAYNCGARCAAEIRAGTKPLPVSTRRYMAAMEPTLAIASPERPGWSIRDLEGTPGPRPPGARKPPVRTGPAEARAHGPRDAARPAKPSRDAKPAAKPTAKPTGIKPAGAKPAAAKPASKPPPPKGVARG
jgi:soluble lytic murein transglycosylase-like protein